MATLEGKTPEQIAAEIVKKAVEPLKIEIDGVRGQRKKQDKAQSEKEKLEYYTLLVSRGVEKIKALEMAGM